MFVDAEIAAMKIDHADIGRILADKWALPLDLEFAIVYHHNPQAVKKIKELVSLIHIADAITHRLDCGLWDNEKPPSEWNGAQAICSIDDARRERIMDSLTEKINHYEEFLSIIKG